MLFCPKDTTWAASEISRSVAGRYVCTERQCTGQAVLLHKDELSVRQPRPLYSWILSPVCPQIGEFGASEVESVRSGEEASVCPRQESIHGTWALQPLLAALTADVLHVAELLHAKLSTTP
jgi:hypothetical protein